MDRVFATERLVRVKATIVIYEDAIDALGQYGTQSYTLDTGQNVERVTKFDLQRLNNVLESLYNRCAILETRLTGSGVVNVRPAW